MTVFKQILYYVFQFNATKSNMYFSYGTQHTWRDCLTHFSKIHFNMGRELITLDKLPDHSIYEFFSNNTHFEWQGVVAMSGKHTPYNYINKQKSNEEFSSNHKLSFFHPTTKLDFRPKWFSWHFKSTVFSFLPNNNQTHTKLTSWW